MNRTDLRLLPSPQKFRSCVFGCRCWSWPDSGLKWTFLFPKGNCKELISICLLEAGRPSFRPELINSSGQKLDFELDLKLEMTETQQMEMKAEGQMENHLIIYLIFWKREGIVFTRCEFLKSIPLLGDRG